MSRLFKLGDHRALLLPLNDDRYDNPAQTDVAWTDVIGSVNEGVGANVLTNDPFRDTPARILCMRHDQDDSLTFYYQFPHGWNKGTINPHVHFMPLADPAAPQVVRFRGQYAWTLANDPNKLPANAGWTVFGPLDMTINPGDVYTQKVAGFHSLGGITPPAFARVESSILVFHFFRNGLDLGDTYTTAKDHGLAQANVGVLSADVHIQIEKIGTITENPEA